MKLSRKNIAVTSLMLFSLFFGAGNLIFPPFLGQSAGNQTLTAMLGFLITAVVLPVMGIVVVARFDGLDRLGQQVGKHFGLVFTVLICLSIGPGLAIPRAASVPFEMAVAPYLPAETNRGVFMILYSLIFFLLVLWLCLTPSKFTERMGKYLTPLLIGLLLILFAGFLFRGEVKIAAAQETYEASPFLTGFAEGYNTMDAIAALNFGLVIATTLSSFGLREKKDVMHYTAIAGVIAGTILALVYAMLTYMGMCSSGVYGLPENGAQTLRAIVYQIFGEPGAVLLAAIFTLACLTTCAGLVNSISQYFTSLFGKLSYRQWVFIISGCSFFVCNLGLDTILSISVPVLDVIYPVSIMLILMGITHDLWKNSRLVYPVVIGGTAIISIIYALDTAGLPTFFVQNLPLYGEGYGWVSVAAVLLVGSLIFERIFCKEPGKSKRKASGDDTIC